MACRHNSLNDPRYGNADCSRCWLSQALLRLWEEVSLAYGVDERRAKFNEFVYGDLDEIRRYIAQKDAR